MVTGRDDDVLCLDQAVVLLAVYPGRFGGGLDLDLLCRLERGRALVDVDLVLAHQEADALDQPVADLAAALLRDAVVELEVIEAESEVLVLAGQDVRQLRVAQERLGWDAADVKADAAQELALHDGDLLTELGRTDRRDVAARPAADHHDIVRRNVSHD